MALRNKTRMTSLPLTHFKGPINFSLQSKINNIFTIFDLDESKIKRGVGGL